jgi:hypothetical protein
MVRRFGRFGRLAATTNTQVEKEMELETSPFHAENLEYNAQMMRQRQPQRTTLDRKREKPISVRTSHYCTLTSSSESAQCHCSHEVFAIYNTNIYAQNPDSGPNLDGT